MKPIIVSIFLCALIVVVGIFFWNSSTYQASKTIEILKKDSVSVLSFGDVMMDRGVRNIMEKYGRDPFEYIKKEGEFIDDFDVVIVNLEGPIVEMPRIECQQKAYNFQFASTTPERLKSVGVTMVTIANNHTYDCYEKGVLSTKRYLTDVGIEYIGDKIVEKSFVVKSIHDKKVAFVGIDNTISPSSIYAYYPLIRQLKLENDYIVVHIHWGTEYERRATDAQKTIAHALVDNGADVVFGHHPHVPGPIEIYKDKVIFYSLGNFVFDQTGEYQTQGYGAGVDFGELTHTFTLYPYKIKTFVPHLLSNEEKEVFCATYISSLGGVGCSFSVDVSR